MQGSPTAKQEGFHLCPLQLQWLQRKQVPLGGGTALITPPCFMSQAFQDTSEHHWKCTHGQHPARSSLAPQGHCWQCKNILFLCSWELSTPTSEPSSSAWIHDCLRPQSTVGVHCFYKHEPFDQNLSRSRGQ